MNSSERKTILITGSTDGVGRRVAQILGSAGHGILVHGRDALRAETIAKQIMAAGGTAHVHLADFSSLAEVRSFADAVSHDHPRIDVLINNAGAGFGRPGGQREVSRDGHELRFAVNYLAPFLLTRLLLPVLTTGSRIVNVASIGQEPIDFADIMLTQRWSGQRAYRQSKLALVMSTFDLAEELRAAGVTVNALHPATFMATTMVEESGVAPQGTIDEGAEAILHLAVQPEMAGWTGGYFEGKRPAKANAQAYDAEARSRLHDLSVGLVGLTPANARPKAASHPPCTPSEGRRISPKMKGTIRMAGKHDAAFLAEPQSTPEVIPARPGRRRFLTMLPLAAGALAVAPVVMRQGSAVNAADATGKRTILITGSTSGMGRRIAERLAAPGTTILIHGRNRQRGEEVMKAVEDAGGDARFHAADFSSLADVRNLADAVMKDNDRLDVLVNNAGIYLGEPATRQLSADGHELRLAINYLAPFALTHRLAPLLARSRPARIVNVASAGQNAIDFDNVMLEHSYSHQRAYGQSKLALIMFTIDIAEELKGSGVTANAVHPANYMDTPMTREAGISPWNSVDEGADAVLHLVNSPQLAETTGMYFSGERQSRANSQAYDSAARERLRALGRQLAGT